MKLIPFTTKNAPHQAQPRRSSQPWIIFRKSGIIQMNMALVQQLRIVDGDRVVLYQDADYPSDWYISRSSNPAAFRVTLFKTRGSIQSNQLVGLVAAAIGINKSTTPPQNFRIPVALFPAKEEIFALCTAKVKMI